MYIIKQTSRFKSSFKKYKSDKRFKSKVFESVLESLRVGDKLDIKYRDHQLSGEAANLRECHIAPDILLIYEIKENELILLLVDIGSHSKLF